MLGATRITSVLGAVYPGFNTAPTSQFTSFLSQASRSGLALMFIRPGTKIPADYRTDAQIKADEKEWYDAGNHSDPPSGVYLATKDSARLRSYAKQARTQVRQEMQHAIDARARSLNIGPTNSEYVAADVTCKQVIKDYKKMAKAEVTELLTALSPVQKAVAQVKSDQIETVLKRSEDITQELGKLHLNVKKDETWIGRIEDVREDLSAWLEFVGKAVPVSDELTATLQGHFEALLEEAGKVESAEDHVHDVSVASGPDSAAYRELDQEAEDKADRAPLSLALEPGASRVVVVDVDTEDEIEAFRTYWYNKTQDVTARIASPTVATPGVLRDGNQWVHRGGGHFYMELPDGYELPEGAPAKITEKVDLGDGRTGSFTIMIHSCYVLIPPSERPEGAYRVLSHDIPWMDWVADLIEEKARPRKDAADSPQRDLAPDTRQKPRYEDPIAEFVSFNNVDDIRGSINDWAKDVSWAELLAPHGWSHAGQDRCGCEIWTAPGSHASPKSATAHDYGCSQDVDEGGRLKIWTDHIDDNALGDMLAAGRSAFSKLQVDAAYNYEGNVSTAMRAHGMKIQGGGDGLKSTRDLLELMMDIASPAEVDSLQESMSTELFSFGKIRDIKPPEYIVDQTLERGGLLSINGPSGVGKSFVVLDLACSLVTGTPWLGYATQKIKVAYAAGEGFTGAVTRVRAWEASRAQEAGRDYSNVLNENLFMSKSAFDLDLMSKDPAELMRVIRLIKESGAELLILDTWARSIPGVDENSAEDVGRVISCLSRLQKMTSCAICVVHHTAKHDPTSGRGSSALKGAMESELLISPHEVERDVTYPGKAIEVRVTKQKNTMEWEEAVVACITPMDTPDPALEDVEVPPGFRIQTASPGWGRVTDVDGAICGAGLGANNFMAKQPEHTVQRIELATQEVCMEIWDMLNDRHMAATEADIVAFLSDKLWNLRAATPDVKQQIVSALGVCVKSAVVSKKGSRYERSLAHPRRDKAQQVIAKQFAV